MGIENKFETDMYAVVIIQVMWILYVLMINVGGMSANIIVMNIIILVYSIIMYFVFTNILINNKNLMIKTKCYFK